MNYKTVLILFNTSGRTRPHQHGFPQADVDAMREDVDHCLHAALAGNVDSGIPGTNYLHVHH